MPLFWRQTKGAGLVNGVDGLGGMGDFGGKGVAGFISAGSAVEPISTGAPSGVVARFSVARVASGDGVFNRSPGAVQAQTTRAMIIPHAPTEARRFRLWYLLFMVKAFPS